MLCCETRSTAAGPAELELYQENKIRKSANIGEDFAASDNNMELQREIALYDTQPSISGIPRKALHF